MKQYVDGEYLVTEYDNGSIERVLNHPVPAHSVPQVVTMRQARLALLNAGKLDAVDAAINAMPSPQKEQARITWDYSAEVHRQSPLVARLAPALGLSDTDIDALFVQADTL